MLKLVFSQQSFPFLQFGLAFAADCVSAYTKYTSGLRSVSRRGRRMAEWRLCPKVCSWNSNHDDDALTCASRDSEKLWAGRESRKIGKSDRDRAFFFLLLYLVLVMIPRCLGRPHIEIRVACCSLRICGTQSSLCGR